MHKQRRGLNSALYHASFTIFILILAALLTGSAWGLGEQAWRTDHQRRWNMFAMIAAYVALVSVSAWPLEWSTRLVVGFGAGSTAASRLYACLFLQLHISAPKHTALTPQALISIVHMWSRVLSVKKILRTMPKPYMPTKQVDVGKVRTVVRCGLCA